jgi:hypothetical protein
MVVMFELKQGVCLFLYLSVFAASSSQVHADLATYAMPDSQDDSTFEYLQDHAPDCLVCRRR